MASDKQASNVSDEAIKKVFDDFDKDGNGSICTKELGEAFKRLGHDYSDRLLKGIMEGLDTDGSMTLDYAEFAKLMKKADKLGWTYKEFKDFDTNGDGFQTVDEVLKMMEGWEGYYDEEDAKNLVKELDVNGDGKISYEEFLAKIAINLSA